MPPPPMHRSPPPYSYSFVEGCPPLSTPEEQDAIVGMPLL